MKVGESDVTGNEDQWYVVIPDLVHSIPHHFLLSYSLTMMFFFFF